MVWKIQRYARQKTVHKGGDTIEWDDFDDKQSPIELRIQQGNMTLIHGKTVRESHVLTSSSKTLRAISKGDTLLVIYRLETHTHRFRVKFSGGENSCQQCAQQLSDFFPVKILPITVESAQQGEKEGKHDKEVVKGEITISKMAEVVNGTASVKLSAAYDRAQSMNGTQLNTLIKLCLADPQFPAFVEEVEKELVKIKDEMKT